MSGGERQVRIGAHLRWLGGLLLACACCIVASVTAPSVSAKTAPAHWIAAWAVSPEAADPDPDEWLLKIGGRTVRERMHVSVGGAAIRVQLSNAFGKAPVQIGSATIGLAAAPAGVKHGSLCVLTFGGRGAVTLPPGAPILSDPVPLGIAPDTDVSLSLYLPNSLTTPTIHAFGFKQAIVTPPGDFTRADRVPSAGTSTASVLVNAVLVRAGPDAKVIVAFGDSITEGVESAEETDRNWPADLARRLAKPPHGPAIAVVNAGIAGNRLLADGPFASLGAGGLARFDRDVLAIAGVTHVVLEEGLNDIGFPGASLNGLPLADPSRPFTAYDVILADRQIIERAHARGLKIIGVTLMPFEGATLPGYYAEAKELQRQAVNAWIRTSGEFDAVVDFDAALRDPAHPRRLQSRYASPDNLHPIDAGYQAMANAIDLSVLQ